MKIIKNYFNIPQPIRRFIDDYNSTIDYFEEAVRYCTPDWQVHEKSITTIQNTDLWIEANIELFPELIEFRKYVRDKMAKLGINKYPDYIYEDHNQYYFKGNRTWNEITESLKTKKSWQNLGN